MVDHSLSHTSILANLVLAVVDLIEQFHPAVNREGNIVKVGSVDKGCRSGVDTLACCILPESTQITISTITIIARLDVSSV